VRVNHKLDLVAARCDFAALLRAFVEGRFSEGVPAQRRLLAQGISVLIRPARSRGDRAEVAAEIRARGGTSASPRGAESVGSGHQKNGSATATTPSRTLEDNPLTH
jgi:hypothetical protein